MIFAHMRTPHSVLVAQRTVLAYSYADVFSVHVHSYTLFTALLLSFLWSLMLLLLHKALALHANEFLSQGP